MYWGNNVIWVAGYDTTANTISFLGYNLALNQEKQDKLIEEVDEVIGDKVRSLYEKI